MTASPALEPVPPEALLQQQDCYYNSTMGKIVGGLILLVIIIALVSRNKGGEVARTDFIY